MQGVHRVCTPSIRPVLTCISPRRFSHSPASMPEPEDYAYHGVPLDTSHNYTENGLQGPALAGALVKHLLTSENNLVRDLIEEYGTVRKYTDLIQSSTNLYRISSVWSHSRRSARTENKSLQSSSFRVRSRSQPVQPISCLLRPIQWTARLAQAVDRAHLTSAWHLASSTLAVPAVTASTPRAHPSAASKRVCTRHLILVSHCTILIRTGKTNPSYVPDSEDEGVQASTPVQAHTPSRKVAKKGKGKRKQEAVPSWMLSMDIDALRVLKEQVELAIAQTE